MSFSIAKILTIQFAVSFCVVSLAASIAMSQDNQVISPNYEASGAIIRENACMSVEDFQATISQGYGKVTYGGVTDTLIFFRAHGDEKALIFLFFRNDPDIMSSKNEACIVATGSVTEQDGEINLLPDETLLEMTFEGRALFSSNASNTGSLGCFEKDFLTKRLEEMGLNTGLATNPSQSMKLIIFSEAVINLNARPLNLNPAANGYVVLSDRGKDGEMVLQECIVAKAIID